MNSSPDGSTTIIVDSCLRQLEAGDSHARERLLELTQKRMERLARTMFQDHPRLARWEELDDVLQRGMLRLWKVLEGHAPRTSAEFFRLAAQVMRRELIDMARHYFGPLGLGRHHVTLATADSTSGDAVGAMTTDSTWNPQQIQPWTEFHEQVEALPEEQRAAFDLLWYQGLRQNEAARLLGVSERTLERRWHEARVAIYRALHQFH